VTWSAGVEGLGFCPYQKCRRRLFSIEIEGDAMTITQLHAGEVKWSGLAAFHETWDTIDVFCRRHGYVTELGTEVLRFQYRCATITLVN
jgi:hypothetical protein